MGTIRVQSQSELLDIAIERSTPIQAERVTNVTGLGWSVEKISTYRGKSAIFIRHHKGVAAAILPTGELKRAPVGKKTFTVDLAKL
jgi:hypothetical protein